MDVSDDDSVEDGETAATVKRARLSGVSPLLRASRYSKLQDVEKIFADADADKDGMLSLEEMRSYFGDYLGYGDAEIATFFRKHGGEASGGISVSELHKGFASLN